MDRPAVYRKGHSARSVDLSLDARSVHQDSEDSLDYLDIPAFLRPDAEPNHPDESPAEDRYALPDDLEAIVAVLNARFPEERAAELDIHTFADLLALGFEAQVVGRLIGLRDDETSEEDVVLAVLAVIAASPAGKRLSRNARRLIRRASRDAALPRSFMKSVSVRVRGNRRPGLMSRLFHAYPVNP